MSRQTARTRRVAELLQQELGPMVQRELRDPRLLWVSILTVDVAPDLGFARVYYSCMPETEAAKDRKEVQMSLERATGYLRKRLSRCLTLRTVPELRFIYDDALERGDRIQHLLHSLQAGESNGG